MTVRRPLVRVGGRIRQLPAGDTLPGVRELLTAARTYYVRTDGNDSNTGLSNTAGGAFATVQKAVNAALVLDNGGNDVTVSVKRAAVTESVTVGASMVGAGRLIIVGDESNPANVQWTTSGAPCIVATNGARVTVGGFALGTTGSGAALFAQGTGSAISVAYPVRFLACAESHCWAYVGGSISIRANYTIAGSAQAHVLAAYAGVVDIQGITVTLVGTPAFIRFAWARDLGLAMYGFNTISGAATGARYLASLGGGVSVSGAGANYLPGNSDGSATSPGWYG